MADKLPQDVKEKLVADEVTPLLQVSINARNGDTVTLPLKLQMTADKNGNPALMAYPVRADLDISRDNILSLSQQEAERLRNGDVLRKTIDFNGEKTNQYLQLDPETKSVIHKRITDFMSNIDNSSEKDFEQTHAPLSYDERVQLLQEGKIGHLRFVLEGDSAQEFLDWCNSHGADPSDDAAEFWLEQTVIDAMDMQVIDDEDYGIWND